MSVQEKIEAIQKRGLQRHEGAFKNEKKLGD